MGIRDWNSATFVICSSATFLGDYFGVDWGGGYTYTSSISTFDYGRNPNYYQQQIVSRIATPST